MAPNCSIKLVCFDLGGVIVRICRTWEDGCRAAGVEIRGDSALDPSAARRALEMSDLHQTGRIDHEQFLREVVNSRGMRYSLDEARRVHAAWLLGEYPGVGDVIDLIHSHSVRTAALSNTNHAHWQAMENYPALRRLQHRLASHELGLVKPDPAIYHEAERRFGVNGRSILFFDDLVANVEAARAVGWNAVQIDHRGDTAAQIERALRLHHVLVTEPTS